MSLQERHVRARIAKRLAPCSSMPGGSVAGSGQQWVKCPGWVIRVATRATLRACADCNALCPAGLRLTDADVRLLPEAVEREVAARDRIENERVRRRFTVHLEELANPGAPFVDRYYVVACGHKVGQTPSGRRFHQATQRRDLLTCEECIRLSRMTGDERIAERKTRSKELAKRFKAKNEAREIARAQLREAMETEVEAVRPGAVAAWDILQLHPGWQRASLDDYQNWPEEHRIVVSEALDAAMMAYKLEHPRTSGGNHWVTAAPDANGRQWSRATGRQVNIVCRYCRGILLMSRPAGCDYSADVQHHTVPCALRFLDPALDVLFAPEIHEIT